MKTRMTLVLATVLACLIGDSYATNEEETTAKESGSASFQLQPKPLDDAWSKWLVGEWEGSAESNAGTAKLWTKIELGLNGQFLVFKSESTLTELSDAQRQYLKETLGASDADIERYRSAVFRDLQTRTVDSKTGEVIGYLFDSMRCIAGGRGKREGNTEIIHWKWSANAQGATSVTIVKRINADKFSLTHEYTLPNGRKMEDKAEMTRKKIKTEK